MAIRLDSFWRGRGGLAPAAPETPEAVLLAAQRDAEERKLLHLGNAYAYIACKEEPQPGSNVKLIQRIAGHATAVLKLDTYARLFDDDLQESAARLAAKLWF